MTERRHDDGKASTDSVDEIQRAWLQERPDTPVSSIGVITRIWRIAKLLDDDRRATMLGRDIDSATRDLLSTLRRAGPPYRLTPGELAERMMVSPGAVSQRLSRAESGGLIARERSGEDGRGVHVALTDQGHLVIERTVDALLDHEERLLDALTDTEREQLAHLLRILLADLTARADSGR